MSKRIFIFLVITLLIVFGFLIFSFRRAEEVEASSTSYTQPCESTGIASCKVGQECIRVFDCMISTCGYSCPSAKPNSTTGTNTCSPWANYNCACSIAGWCGGTAYCTISAGDCTYNCTSPYEDCNALAGDGCEINTNTDPANCGSCGNVCPSGSTDYDYGDYPYTGSYCRDYVYSCSGGSCDSTVYRDTCIGTPANNLRERLDSGPGCTYTDHTGGTSRHCYNTTNDYFIDCTAPYKNCNLDPADICEVNTDTDENNCGDCGPAFACALDEECVGGVCIPPVVAPPTVTTSAATGVTSSQATLNGDITSTGGEDASERGFEWDTDSGTPYANFWTETATGPYGTGGFNRTITGLDPSTTYYFRAKAYNSTGWGYGGEVSFTTVETPSVSNVWGWAWSENIGWISFNSENCDVDGDGTYEGSNEGGGATPAPAGCPSSGTAYTYGVKADEVSGEFQGCAWSSNIGWISFNRSDTGDPPGPPFQAGPGAIAKLDLDGTVCGGVNLICGWVRALAYGDGWDGWIKLRGWTTEAVPTEYGVSLNSGIGEFEGFAWGSDVVGWISFNCLNLGVCTSSTAEGGPSDYKVMTSLAVPSNPPDPPSNPHETWDYCNHGGSPNVVLGAAVTLHWEYSDPDGHPQYAYEIWVDDDSGFGGGIDPDFNYLVSPSASNAYTLDLSDDPESGLSYPLDWSTTYYWQVRVQDEPGDWSGWSKTATLETPTFDTPSHASPNPDFDWSPKTPSTNEVIQFTDLTTCYNSCPASGYEWDFGDGNTVSGQKEPTHSYLRAGDYIVTLTVTDSSNYHCSKSKDLTVIFPLPGWKEIPPF